jgi:hypothetical protein
VTDAKSLRWKCVCVVTSGVSLAAFFAMCGVSLARFYEPIAMCEWLAAVSIGGFTWSLGAELDGNAAGSAFADSIRAPPIPGRGMSLGSVWRGRAPDEGELLDVLVASASDE